MRAVIVLVGGLAVICLVLLLAGAWFAAALVDED